MSDITFVIFTFNEEKRIERVIRNFKDAGPILVVDNYSVDRTVEIARSHGCDVLLNKNPGWVEDPVTAGRVKETVKTPWIYWGYADEIVDRSTLGKITAGIADPAISVLQLYRKNYFYGRFCHEEYAHLMNRVFRPPAIDFSANKIHHFGRVTVPDAQIRALPREYFVHHFITYTAREYLASLDRYTDIEAQESAAEPRFLRALASACKVFVQGFFLQGGYKAGRAGLNLALFQGANSLLGFIKKVERSRQLTPVGIEETNNRVRDEILRELDEPLAVAKATVTI
jgi:glycosyltransferase involved in cell wall biosynthesis